MANTTPSYKLKHIAYFGRDIPIALQNENGPCPLLAIANVLLLRNQIQLPAAAPDVLQDRLVSLVAEYLLDSNSEERIGEQASAEYKANLRKNIEDAIALLPKLTTGVDVNVRFNDTKGFEFTDEVLIFDLLDINLVHGWLVDPQDAVTAAAVGQKSYNELMAHLVNVLGSETPTRLLTPQLSFRAGSGSLLQRSSSSFSKAASQTFATAPATSAAAPPDPSGSTRETAAVTGLGADEQALASTAVSVAAAALSPDQTSGSSGCQSEADAPMQVASTGSLFSVQGPAADNASQLDSTPLAAQQLHRQTSSDTSAAPPSTFAISPIVQQVDILAGGAVPMVPPVSLEQYGAEATAASQQLDEQDTAQLAEALAMSLSLDAPLTDEAVAASPAARQASTAAASTIAESDKVVTDSDRALEAPSAPAAVPAAVPVASQHEQAAQQADAGQGSDDSLGLYVADSAVEEVLSDVVDFVAAAAAEPEVQPVSGEQPDSTAGAQTQGTEQHKPDATRTEAKQPEQSASKSAGSSFSQEGLPIADSPTVSAGDQQQRRDEALSNARLKQQAYIIQDFLESTSSQLTYHGLCELQKGLRPNELAVFFRNNHFNAVFFHQGAIHVLVTDQGYENEQDVVWERLDDVSGNTHFLRADFQPYGSQDLSGHLADQAAAAANLAQQAFGVVVPTKQLPTHGQEEPGLDQTDADFALALHLQEEEKHREQQIRHQQRQEQQRQQAKPSRAARPEAYDNPMLQASGRQQGRHPRQQRPPPPAPSSKQKDKCTIM